MLIITFMDKKSVLCYIFLHNTSILLINLSDIQQYWWPLSVFLQDLIKWIFISSYWWKYWLNADSSMCWYCDFMNWKLRELNFIHDQIKPPFSSSVSHMFCLLFFILPDFFLYIFILCQQYLYSLPKKGNLLLFDLSLSYMSLVYLFILTLITFQKKIIKNLCYCIKFHKISKSFMSSKKFMTMIHTCAHILDPWNILSWFPEGFHFRHIWEHNHRQKSCVPICVDCCTIVYENQIYNWKMVRSSFLIFAPAWGRVLDFVVVHVVSSILITLALWNKSYERERNLELSLFPFLIIYSFLTSSFFLVSFWI